MRLVGSRSSSLTELFLGEVNSGLASTGRVCIVGVTIGGRVGTLFDEFARELGWELAAL